MSILLQNPFQHFPIPCPRPATRTAQNSLPRSPLTSEKFGNGKLREIMGGCGKIKGSGRIRIPDLSLETFLRRPHEMKQDFERFRPDGPPRTYAIRAGPEIKNPCKIFARALKGDCGFISPTGMDAVAEGAEWIIGMRRKFHHGAVCDFRETFAVFAPPSLKEMFFNRDRYCHTFPPLANTRRRRSSRRLKSFRRPDLRKRKRTLPTAN